MKEIFLTLKEKNELEAEIKCVRSTLLKALKGKGKSTLCMLIRRRAEEIVMNRELNDANPITESHA